MEYEEHEDQEEEMEIQLPKMEGEGASLAVRKGGGGVGTYCYRECLKNHAVGIGGHAVDGCGEFMPAGEEGTLDGLKCAACSCHRNFHRRESEGEGGGFLHHHIPPYYRTGYFQVAPPPNQLPLPLPSTSREDQDDDDSSNPSGGSRKRFRTKFSQEQKNKMLALAEELGWRIQKHDEATVQQFCAETGVKRQVLKVWMHNNKHTLGRKP